MQKEQFKEALALAKEGEKRNFTQSYEMIVNLRDLDLKQPEQQVDLYVALSKGKGKKIKVCALVGPELLEQAKQACDFAVPHADFIKYAQNKKLVKKLGRDYDFFIAQVSIMPDVAKTFGRVLGPKGKMPNPKAGCVVPPNANLKPLVEKLQKTVRVVAKAQPSIKVMVGTEKMSDEDVLDNIHTVYDQVIHHLPGEESNVKSVILKTTMGKPVRVGAKK